MHLHILKKLKIVLGDYDKHIPPNFLTGLVTYVRVASEARHHRENSRWLTHLLLVSRIGVLMYRKIHFDHSTTVHNIYFLYNFEIKNVYILVNFLKTILYVYIYFLFCFNNLYLKIIIFIYNILHTNIKYNKIQ